MDKFKLIREISSNKATLGRLVDSDGKEICKTLENPWLNNHVKISCIPLGIYSCLKDDTGKFKYWKVLGVEGRSGIEIHPGNFERDTLGCILFGKDWVFMYGELAVNSSRATLDRLKNEGVFPAKFELEIV